MKPSFRWAFRVMPKGKQTGEKQMKKKTIRIVSILVGVLLIGIVSAGLIDFFGKITATIEVESYVFYTTPEEVLLFNEEPTTHDNYTIINGNAIVFWTEENFGGIDFYYMPKIDLYVRAKVNNATPSKPLELIFGYSDTSNVMHEICSLKVDISTEALDNYHASCDGSSIPEDVNEFYYKMQGEGYISIEYLINTENTKAEIIGAVE